MEHTSLTVLASGIVLDKSKMPQDAAELSILLAGAYSSGKSVVIVPNASAFFSANNLIKALENGDASWQLIVEKFELSITDRDLETIRRSVEIRKEIVEKLTPLYPFATPPKGFNVELFFRIKGGSTPAVQRTQTNNEGDGMDYSIGLRALSNVWARAARHWAKLENQGDTRVDASGYTSQRVIYSADRVQIGCQVVRRYELEQFALAQGWDFPDP